MSAVEEYRGAHEYVTKGTHWVHKPLADAAIAELEAENKWLKKSIADDLCRRSRSGDE